MSTKSRKHLFYFGILPALFFQLIGAFIYYVLLTDPSVVQVVYFGVKILVLGWPIIWWFVFRDDFKKRGKVDLKVSLFYGFASGIFIFFFMLAVFFLFQNFFIELSDNFSREAQELGILDHYLLFSVVLSVFHAFLEEYFWRWFVFRGLLVKLSAKWAIFISAIAFMSHHLIVMSQFFSAEITILFGVAIAFIAAVWSLMYLRTNGLLAGWISHVFADAAIMFIGYLLIF